MITDFFLLFSPRSDCRGKEAGMAEAKKAAKSAVKKAQAEPESGQGFDVPVRVVIRRRIRSALGAYDIGDVVSLPGGIARSFIADGRATEA